MIGFARFNCDEGHARIAIRVKIQVAGAGWITLDTETNSNLQAKTVAGSPSGGCFLWHGTDATDTYRTYVEYARAFNAAGKVIHSRSDVAGPTEEDPCLA
jgi:hypothetical protein